MTILVNLYGAPGSGKSTGAAYIFSKLKMAGFNCELVTEFAKDKVWEESKEVFNNQIYMFGKQYFRLSRLNGKVDIIITDSPLFCSKIYANNTHIGNILGDLANHIESTEFQPINFFMERMKKYNPSGRFQTEEQSNDIAKLIKTTMDAYDIVYNTFNGVEEDYDVIVDTITAYAEIYNSNTGI